MIQWKLIVSLTPISTCSLRFIITLLVLSQVTIHSQELMSTTRVLRNWLQREAEGRLHECQMRSEAYMARMPRVPHYSQFDVRFFRTSVLLSQSKVNNTIGTYYLIYKLFIPFI